MEAVEQGDWDTADLYIARLESSNQHNLAHLARAESLYYRKQPSLALVECNRIRDDGQLRVRAATLMGKCLLDLGAFAETDRMFSFVLSREPDSIEAHRGIATVAMELGQSDRAVHHLRHVIRLDPTDARPHRMLGDVFDGLGDRDNLLFEYGEALRLGKGLTPATIAQVRFDLAEAQIKASYFAAALTTLDEGRDGQPEPPEMVGLRVRSLRGLGRRQEAVAITDRALNVWTDGVFFLLRGQLYLDDGDAKSAVTHLEKATRLLPNDYQSHFLLAQAYAAVERKDDAAKALARAESINDDYNLAIELEREAMSKPWDSAVRLKLAQHCERMGDTKSAAVWRRAAAQCQAVRR